jgi:uncharacterized protein
MDFAQKVCVVTGASSGIGRRVAADLAAAGASVCVVARRAERLRAVVDSMEGTGHSHVVADVSERDQVLALARVVGRRYGRCDVLVNSAGLSKESRFARDDAIDVLSEIVATNFFGTAYCTHALLPLLKDSAPSNVVNISSVAGRLPVRGSSAYNASKFALAGWSEALHMELRGDGVCVSIVEPGPVPTEGFPHEDLVSNRLFRWATTPEADVSKAVLDTIRKNKMQRVVPRWFYLLQVPRLVAPPLYRAGQSLIAGRRRR